mgnify:CR=1 FL=1
MKTFDMCLIAILFALQILLKFVVLKREEILKNVEKLKQAGFGTKDITKIYYEKVKLIQS